MQTISFEVDDTYYQNLISRVKQENFALFFKQVSEPYLKNQQNAISSNTDRPYRLGALPNINIPDDFDDIEITDFDI